MKKYIIFYVILLLLSTKGAAAEAQSDELTDLAQLVTDEVDPLEQWTVTLKETRNESALMTSVSKARENGYEIAATENEKAHYYQWTATDNQNDVSTEFKVIVPNKRGYKAEIIAAISGSSWDTTVKNAYMEMKMKVIDQYFLHNFTEFTCLTTTKRDILSDGYVEQLFKDMLDMTYIKKQNDSLSKRHKKIVYGYTDLWANDIRTEDEPMNFQMVLQKGPNDGIRLTLGTPILIDEY